MPRTRRRRRSGCNLDSPEGKLRFRYRVAGKQKSRATRLDDTAANRAILEPWRKAVAGIVKAGQDPGDWLDQHLREPARLNDAPDPPPAEHTVAAYFAEWIATAVPPLIRKAQARDYRRHLEGYVLPALGKMPVAEVTPRDARDLQQALLTTGRRVRAGERPAGLSVKYVRNILSGSTRAMFQQALTDGVIVSNPFGGLKWPEWEIPEANPFRAEQRDAILAWFERKVFGFRPGCRPNTRRDRFRVHRPYYVYVHLLFWTGLRPSEASGLQWRDVDLLRGRLYVRRSYHLGAYGKPKTRAARRTVQLFPLTVRLLRDIQPLRVTPDLPVFTNTTGGPVEPNSLLPHWYACQRALGIAVRGLYCMKDTFVTLVLDRMRKRHEFDFQWLEQQTGVSYATLKRHYAKWWPDADEDALRKFVADDADLFVENASS
jgi:integrase